MKAMECENGHVYDWDEYPDGCPYCKDSYRSVNYDTGNRTGNFGGDSTDYGKTVRPNDTVTSDTVNRTIAPGFGDDQRTIIKGYTKNAEFPVTGWIVCIEGKLKGKAFEIYDRINHVGRNEDMDIRLDDREISRDDHARIAYESRNKFFTLIAGNNSNNIYLNGESVYSERQLKAYDCIEFGSSKFVFIPLCGEQFNWENGLASTQEQ